MRRAAVTGTTAAAGSASADDHHEYGGHRQQAAHREGRKNPNGRQKLLVRCHDLIPCWVDLLGER